jgi:hypothetical protein
MNDKKRKILDATGWNIGSASDFLGLTPEEERHVEDRLLLDEHLKKEGKQKPLSQSALAKRPRNSQKD